MHDEKIQAPTKPEPTPAKVVPITKNRKQKRAEQAAHNRAVKKLGGPTMAAAGVLMKQRAVLARLISALAEKHGGTVRLSYEDLDNARHLGLVAEKGENGEPVLVIANGDVGDPMGISIADLVTLLSIGSRKE